MKKPWEIISELQSDNSRLFKESVIMREAEAGNEEFFTGARYCLDNMITFGVKQVPEREGEDGIGLDFVTFMNLAQNLELRQLTGNAARDAVMQYMKLATNDQWNNWYRRILIKDLRCGVSDKTINVVKKKYPRFEVPVFAVQLAHDGASDNHAAKVRGKKLCGVKLDGVRVATIVWPDGRVLQCSRNGKEFKNFEVICNQFSGVADQLDQPYVFDGEVMSSSFQDLMKQVYRKTDVAANDSVLYLFDMIPLTDFVKGKCNIKQKDRSATLEKWFEDKIFLQLVNVRVLSQVEVDLDTVDGYNEFKRINESAIANGYEGIMLKDPDAPYECKRTSSWLKVKPTISVDLEIVGVEEGSGKYAGMLGAFVCSGIDDGREIHVNVGSGFSDDQRKEYFTPAVIGSIIEVLADAVTQNQDGSYSLRFPRFKTFRGFSNGEKL